MRRLVLSCSCIALGVISLALSGCYTTGICDCENGDPCLRRAPWVRDLPVPPPGTDVKSMPRAEEKTEQKAEEKAEPNKL